MKPTQSLRSSIETKSTFGLGALCLWPKGLNRRSRKPIDIALIIFMKFVSWNHLPVSGLLLLISQYLGTHLLGEFLIFIISNQVGPFVGILLVIVQFLGTVFVAEVTISLRLGRGVLRAIAKKGKIPGGRWVFQEWQNGTPLQMTWVLGCPQNHKGLGRYRRVRSVGCYEVRLWLTPGATTTKGTRVVSLQMAALHQWVFSPRFQP